MASQRRRSIRGAPSRPRSVTERQPLATAVAVVAGATRGTVRYRFRARIRREAAYPYELGYSRSLVVTVRG